MIVTIVSLFAMIPYIAIQLKAVTLGYQVLVPGSGDGADEVALFSAGVLAFFAILFGTRKVNLTEQNPGIMGAVAFESIFKLVALVVLAVAVWINFFGDWQTFVGHLNTSTPYLALDSHQDFFFTFSSTDFITQTLLAMAAVICLPRQFHVAVVENTTISHLRTAAWVFPLYLGIISLVVIPIALAGTMQFPGGDVSPDSFVLNLPEQNGWSWLSILVYLGGFSAATSMIIVATLTLSSMVSNDVVMPLVLKSRAGKNPGQDLSHLIIFIRRVVMIMVMLLAWLFYRTIARNYDLAAMGLLAFALVAQLVPAIIGGLYWRRGNAYGAGAGILVGSFLWFYTLMLPTLADLKLIGSDIVEYGPWHIDILKPTSLFSMEFSDLTHGVFYSLLMNTACYVFVSWFTRVRLLDRLQAEAYVRPQREQIPRNLGVRRNNVVVRDILTLMERFIGSSRTETLVRTFVHEQGEALDPDKPPKPPFVQFVERELAGVIGSSSARAMIDAAIEGKQLELEQVVNFFDDTTQAVQFSQEVLFSTLEHLSQGVSVIDKDLKLVAWNKRYLEMFEYPEGMIRVGRPVEDLVRLNAEKGECGPGDVDQHVARRMAHMKRGTPYVFRRHRADGKVYEMNGNPIPGGGFVTSFSDITEYVQACKELEESRAHLETRVEERTQTIMEMNSELLKEIQKRAEGEELLRQAKAEADSANASKSRFLALASHDILQPLNAARLYTSALHSCDEDDRRKQLVNQLDNSLAATEDLISTLLQIAKLDDGAMKPELAAIDLNPFIKNLADEFGIIAEQKGLTLHWVATSCKVTSDPLHLRRIVQNLLANAVKYTDSGKVLLGVRHRKGFVEIQVWDTGPGIPEVDQTRIFDDFYRIENQVQGKEGVGLGLGVTNRLAKLLAHELRVSSVPGHGAMFSVRVPVSTAVVMPRVRSPHAIRGLKTSGLHIVCVDDDRRNLDALAAQLHQWQIDEVSTFFDIQASLDFAAVNEAPDLLILDYQLSKEMNGIELYMMLKEQWDRNVPAILISANQEQSLLQQAKSAGMIFIAKPVKPAPLRSAINSFATRFAKK